MQPEGASSQVKIEASVMTLQTFECHHARVKLLLFSIAGKCAKLVAVSENIFLGERLDHPTLENVARV